MRHVALLAIALMIGTSIGCCCLNRGCGPCGGGTYGSYYGGSSCPDGNCGIAPSAFNNGYNGLQSASIPGAYPATAAAPIYPTTAAAPIVVNPTATAAAPVPTYTN